MIMRRLKDSERKANIKMKTRELFPTTFVSLKTMDKVEKKEKKTNEKDLTSCFVM